MYENPLHALLTTLATNHPCRGTKVPRDQPLPPGKLGTPLRTFTPCVCRGKKKNKASQCLLSTAQSYLSLIILTTDQDTTLCTYSSCQGMRTRDTGQRTRDTGCVSLHASPYLHLAREVGGTHSLLILAGGSASPALCLSPPGKLPHQERELPLRLDAPEPKGQLWGVPYLLGGLKSTKSSLSRLHQGHRRQHTLYSEEPCFPRPHGQVFSPAQGAAGDDMLPATRACVGAKPQLRARSCRKPQPASRQPARYVGVRQGESSAAARSAAGTWPSTRGP